jgi:electron-transferring-flavoprotein dehydrogenase
VPKLAFPGGALIGDSAGFVNVPRHQGQPQRDALGILAAEHAAAALGEGRANDTLESYDAAWRGSEIGRDLRPVRNVKPLWSKFGTLGGVVLGGLDMMTNQWLGFSFFGTLGHGKSDAASLKPASQFKPIDYPKPDGVISFDRLSSVFLSNTNHEEDQPVHLRVATRSAEDERARRLCRAVQRYCPAGVYEWVSEEGEPALRHQRAELRPLQDLRHQGSEREHHLGAAARRRGAGLSEHVTDRHRASGVPLYISARRASKPKAGSFRVS